MSKQHQICASAWLVTGTVGDIAEAFGCSSFVHSGLLQNLHFAISMKLQGLCFRYTVIKNGRQRLYMPNSRFLTSEFMVLDAKRASKGRRNKSRHNDQSDSSMEPDLTRPLGPGMAYGGWGEELERQRVMAASR